MIRKAEMTGTMAAVRALKISRRLRSRPKRRRTRKARITCSRRREEIDNMMVRGTENG